MRYTPWFLAAILSSSGCGPHTHEDTRSATTPTLPEPQAHTCVFGEAFRDVRDEAGVVVITRSQSVPRSALPPSLLEVARGLPTRHRQPALSPILTPVTRFDLWDVSSRAPYVAYVQGERGEERGVILRAGSTQQVALLRDGEFAWCGVSPGAERRACGRDEDCASGHGCQGIHEGEGACLDWDAHDSRPSVCTKNHDCAQGALCAGAEIEGACHPAWGRRAFRSRPALQVSARGVEVELGAHGLATVPTDVWLDARLTSSGRVRVWVENPEGKSSHVLTQRAAGELRLQSVRVRGLATGDANGTWRVRVSDSSGEGVLHEIGVTLMSRWD